MATQKSQDKNSLERIDKWINRLEQEAERLLQIAAAGEMDAFQAMQIALKCLAQHAKLLEQRQLFEIETGEDDQALRESILGSDYIGLN